MHPFHLICVNLRHLRFKGFNDGIRARPLGALVLTLLFGLLPALPWAEHAVADDRVLRVQDGSAMRQYTVAELIAAIGLTERRVAKNPHFGPDRVFAGFALRPLLDHIGLGDAQELLLVCADDYRIAFDTSTLSKRPVRDYVRHDRSDFPQSKMPQFSKLLPSTEIDQIVAYLQAMQPAQ